MTIPGYEIPIHRSLTEQILLGGVPRAIAIINGTLIATLGLGLRSYFAIPFGIAFHFLAMFVTRTDPEFFQCFRRHLKQKNLYTV